MNKASVQKRVNQNLCLFRRSNRQTNCLRWGSGETDNHISTKLEVCKALKSKGHDFISEAIFLAGDRADVVDLVEGIVYEVVDSESEESIDNKKSRYPMPLFAIRAGSPVSEVWDFVGEY